MTGFLVSVNVRKKKLDISYIKLPAMHKYIVYYRLKEFDKVRSDRHVMHM